MLLRNAPELQLAPVVRADHIMAERWRRLSGLALAAHRARRGSQANLGQGGHRFPSSPTTINRRTCFYFRWFRTAPLGPYQQDKLEEERDGLIQVWEECFLPGDLEDRQQRGLHHVARPRNPVRRLGSHPGNLSLYCQKLNFK